MISSLSQKSMTKQNCSQYYGKHLQLLRKIRELNHNGQKEKRKVKKQL